MSIRKASNLLDDVRRFMRVRRYSIHTERAYCERLHVPVLMTRDEVRAVITLMQGTPQLIAKLLYGCGLRIMEAVRLRVQAR